MLETLWGVLMEGESTVGFLVIIAFLLGAGVQKWSAPNGKELNQISSVLSLLEALASHVGAPDKADRKDPDQADS